MNLGGLGSTPDKETPTGSRREAEGTAVVEHMVGHWRR